VNRVTGACVDAVSSEMECVCCREFGQVDAMLADESVQCITLHPRFAAVCLEHEVLHAVLVLMHDMQRVSYSSYIHCHC